MRPFPCDCVKSPPVTWVLYISRTFTLVCLSTPALKLLLFFSNFKGQGWIICGHVYSIQTQRKMLRCRNVANIIYFMVAIYWRHAACMREILLYSDLVWKPKRKWQPGRTSHGYENNIEIYSKETGKVNVSWILFRTSTNYGMLWKWEWTSGFQGIRGHFFGLP